LDTEVFFLILKNEEKYLVLFIECDSKNKGCLRQRFSDHSLDDSRCETPGSGPNAGRGERVSAAPGPAPRVSRPVSEARPRARTGLRRGAGRRAQLTQRCGGIIEPHRAVAVEIGARAG